MAGNRAELKISEALDIIKALGLPEAQHNERTALVLLSLCDIRKDTPWKEASSPMRGITPIMDWIREAYDKEYAPNTRETIRKDSIHQLVDAGIAVYNPDDPARPVNSPKAAYRLTPEALQLISSYGGPDWNGLLKKFLEIRSSLTSRYAMEREIAMVPVQIGEGIIIKLSPGKHSRLIRDIIEQFAPRFAPGSKLVYIGDTGDKWGYHDEKLLGGLGVPANAHGKMPDVVLLDENRNWLFLIESVTSTGPMDGKRIDELKTLFASSEIFPVYVTAFPNRGMMARYLPVLAWETEVWIADSPTHMIHLNGEKFLGPYD